MASKVKKECLYPLCEKSRSKKLWCNSHYIQQRRSGFESMWSATPFDSCVYRECDKKPVSRGMCGRHYKYIYSGGIPKNPDRYFNAKLDTCAVIACKDITRRSLMCSAHESLCHKYNLSCIQLSALMIEQNFSCKICKCTESKLYVDHDHKCCHDERNTRHYKRCGKCNRGLLCVNCNFGLASFHDDPETMHAALGYLERRIDIFFIEDSMGVDAPGSRLWQSRWYRYSVGPNRFKYMMDLLDNKCPICRGDFDEIHMDHCHATGDFRMPLCRSCNHGLGHVRDNPEILLSMIQYVKRHKMEMIE